jgi:hypothetical protein
VAARYKTRFTRQSFPRASSLRWRTSPCHTHSHVCGNSHQFLSSDIQRDGAGGICGDHVNVRHRNEDGDKCVWVRYTWVFPTANTMTLRARPRKWMTCEPGLSNHRLVYLASMTRWHRVVWQLFAHFPEAPCCYWGPHVASPLEGQTDRYAYRLARLCYFVMFDTAGVCV